MSYVAFTLRIAMLSIDARIGIEPILQVPKTWVISHYTIEQTFTQMQIYNLFYKLKTFQGYFTHQFQI